MDLNSTDKSYLERGKGKKTLTVLQAALWFQKSDFAPQLTRFA